jgi:uncharacterized protein
MAGSLVHFELPSEDAERAKRFWGGVFGWTFSDPGVAGLQYWMTQTGENQGGAIFEADGPRGMIVYFDTDDIDASLARVRELGGTSEEKQPIPHVGWFARCTDTEGNDFSLFQRDDSVSA